MSYIPSCEVEHQINQNIKIKIYFACINSDYSEINSEIKDSGINVLIMPYSLGANKISSSSIKFI